MNLKQGLLKISEKIEKMDINRKKIIVWGMGYVAALYENAFKIAGIKIYAYV